MLKIQKIQQIQSFLIGYTIESILEKTNIKRPSKLERSESMGETERTNTNSFGGAIQQHKLITYPHRRGIRFVFDLASDVLSFFFSFFLSF